MVVMDGRQQGGCLVRWVEAALLKVGVGRRRLAFGRDGQVTGVGLLGWVMGKVALSVVMHSDGYPWSEQACEIGDDEGGNMEGKVKVMGGGEKEWVMGGLGWWLMVSR
ncbi:hypothetical protein Dimus_014138 [Dionaea muscipula]